MNSRRCELCGELYSGRSGGVSISVPKDDVCYYSHDHYNICEACALKVYDIVESLKTSENQSQEKRSVLSELVQNQNATILKLRRCLRGANSDLTSATKHLKPDEISDVATRYITSAMEWLDKAEIYNMED